MDEVMKKKLEAAITTCADKATSADTALDALQYTQAVQNAANALSLLHCNFEGEGV